MASEKVMVPVEACWCARHWGLIPFGCEHLEYACDAVRYSEDDGRCVPVPLYVEAPDP